MTTKPMTMKTLKENMRKDRKQIMKEDCISEEGAILREIWPVAIVQDRYHGSYSGGAWIAISESDERYRSSCGDFNCHQGPYGDDSEARNFWDGHRDEEWIAVGNTPNEALDNLVAKYARPQEANKEKP